MSFRLQSVSYGLDNDCEGAEVLALHCGLDAREELTVSELGLDGPLQDPEVVIGSEEEFWEALWTEKDDRLSAEPLSSAADGSGGQSLIKTDGCSLPLEVVT